MAFMRSGGNLLGYPIRFIRYKLDLYDETENEGNICYGAML